MALSDRQLLHSLSRMPFIDVAELPRVLGEAPTAVHCGLTDLLVDGIVGRVSHGTAYLHSSRRNLLTTHGVGEATGVLGFETPSDFRARLPCVKRSGSRC